MRSGGAGQAERVLQRDQRLAARHALALPALGLGLGGELGIALRELQQAALGPALRRPHDDLRPAPGAERGGDVLGLFERRDDLGRDRRRLPVELEQELLEHVAGLPPLGVVDEERLSVDHRPVAHAEDLQVAARLALVQADHVEGLDRLDARRLSLLHVAHGLEAVAQQGRLLELLRLRRLLHRTFDVALDGAQPPAQEVDDLGDDLRVLVVLHPPVARPQGALDEELQAGRAAHAPRLPALALAVGEDAPEHVEGLAHLARAGVGPEVEVAGHVAAAEEAHARPLVDRRDLDPRVALVVAQAQVEGRPVLLDEVVLEEEGLGLGGGHHPLEVAGACDHLGRASVRRRGAACPA